MIIQCPTLRQLNECAHYLSELKMVGSSTTVQNSKSILYPSISICPVRMWMDPIYLDGQDPNIFGRSPNVNDTLTRLRYKKLRNETRFEAYILN